MRILSDRLAGTAFIISLTGHLVFLALPLEFKGNSFDLRQEMTVAIEIEKPSILPRIEKMGEERKVKKVESSKFKVASKDFPDNLAKDIEAEDLSEEARLRFQDMVKRKIEEARYYPYRAKERYWEGMVRVKFSILPDGRIGNMKMLNSSGYRVLDEAAKRTVSQAGPFPPLPATISFKSVEMEVNIVFTLD